MFIFQYKASISKRNLLQRSVNRRTQPEEMIYMTMIGRIGDGLPLVSFQQDDMMANNLLEYQSQAKQLFKKMTVNSPNKGSLESNNYFFHYYIDRSICYLTLCDQNFSKRLAFQFLEDIQLEFSSLYGQKVIFPCQDNVLIKSACSCTHTCV